MGDGPLLAVDVGTAAIKAAVWRRLGAGHARRLTATKGCIARMVGRSDAARMAVIGVCGRGDRLWALDVDQRPVRNTVLWNDSRADELLLALIQSGVSPRLPRICRTSHWAGTAATILAQATRASFPTSAANGRRSLRRRRALHPRDSRRRRPSSTLCAPSNGVRKAQRRLRLRLMQVAVFAAIAQSSIRSRSIRSRRDRPWIARRRRRGVPTPQAWYQALALTAASGPLHLPALLAPGTPWAPD